MTVQKGSSISYTRWWEYHQSARNQSNGVGSSPASLAIVRRCRGMELSKVMLCSRITRASTSTAPRSTRPMRNSESSCRRLCRNHDSATGCLHRINCAVKRARKVPDVKRERRVQATVYPSAPDSPLQRNRARTCCPRWSRGHACIADIWREAVSDERKQALCNLREWGVSRAFRGAVTC